MRFELRSLIAISAAWSSLLCLGPTEQTEAQGSNVAPIAAEDAAFHSGFRFAIDVLANDFEPDGEAVSVVASNMGTGACSGQVIEDFGLLIIEPGAGTPETCSFTYHLEDERGLTSSEVTVSLTAADSPIFSDGFESGDTSSWE